MTFFMKTLILKTKKGRCSKSKDLFFRFIKIWKKIEEIEGIYINYQGKYFVKEKVERALGIGDLIVLLKDFPNKRLYNFLFFDKKKIISVLLSVYMLKICMKYSFRVISKKMRNL